MRLKQLLTQLDLMSAEGALDRDVVGISYDSRRVTPGMVFVAIPGQRTDGHDYIQSAIDRGAVAVVCEQNGFVHNRAAKIMVSDARQALAQLATAFYQGPSQRLKMIGVTGTNGKTTVAFLIKHLLESAGIQTGLLGTIRYEIGKRVIPAARTTPESPEIQHMLAQMLKSGAQACVMEVSSHALEQKRVNGVHFDVVIFTNLTRDHLDFHQTMEAYYAAKKKLFMGGPQRNPSRWAIINHDDLYGAQLLQEAEADRIWSYGLDPTAAIRADQVELGSQGSQLRIHTPAGSFSCLLPLLGRHNIYNTLAAVGAGCTFNLKNAQLQNALNTMPPVPGRLERIQFGQPFNVLVDYAHTDDALSNVLNTLREITTGRLVLVFGCGGNRDVGKRPKMGRVAADLADLTIITSDNSRRESAAAIAQQIEAGFLSGRSSTYQIELDRRRAIEAAIRMARAGDTVLIAGKGHETYQEYEDTIVPFDDRVYAQEAIENLGFAVGA